MTFLAGLIIGLVIGIVLTLWVIAMASGPTHI